MVTKAVKLSEEHSAIHVNVEMHRTGCPGCRNQGIKVYILYQPLPKQADQIQEAVRILENQKSVATLQNNQDNTGKTHRFHSEPKSRQFSIVFLSAGSCTLIKDISIYYFFCEKNTSTGVNLPKTDAPASGSRRVNVSCPENTLNPGNDQAYGLCSSEGKWDIISPCMCKKGYTLNTIEEGCMGKL